MIHGRDVPGSKTILIYGNCQVPFISRLLSAIDDTNDEYRFVSVFNHAPPGQEIPIPDQEHLDNTVVFLEQFDQRPVEPMRDHVREHLPSSCPMLLFPPIFMACFWPFECHDPRNTPEPPRFPYGRFPSGDSIALKVAKLGLAGDAAYDAYREMSHQAMPDMENRLEWDVDRIQRTDLVTHVSIGNYVLANFAKRHMFWTQGHIDAITTIELTRRIYALIKPVIGGSFERAEIGFERVARDFIGMGEMQLPIHPEVASALKLDFYEPDMKFQWLDQSWTFREYTTRFIANDKDW